MVPEDEDLIKEDGNMVLHDDDNSSGDDDGEQDQQGDWREDLQSDIEQDGEELKHSGETAHLLEVRQLDEKLRENLAGLTSKEFTVRLHATKGFRHMLKEDSGGQVLKQYIQASPGCIELLEAWKLGVETESVVLIFSLVTEILKHPAGKDIADDLHRASGDKQSDELKLRMYVRLRLDKFARTIIRTRMKDVYSQITSHDRKRQNAALLLMAAIVRRGRALASQVAAGFDFTLKVLPKLAEQVQRKGKQKGSGEDNRPVSINRRGFIEFAMSFLEVSTPSLLRWVLQIRPLYAGVLRGLAKDDEKTIVYVLTIIQEKVLGANSMMPPGLRSAVFGDAALEQLSVISADSSLGRAADIAHDTLMMLCTDPCHGLLPEFPQQWDISTPSASLQKGNPARLMRLLLKLRPADVDNHRNLVLAIVNCRSLLASAYLDKFPYSLEPRATSAWFAAVSLLSDLICAAKVSPAFSTLAAKGFYPPSLDSYALQSRLKCILPRSFTRVVINRGLLHANMLVKHGSLRVLLEALSSLECLLNSVLAAVENVPEKGPTTDLPKESLLEFLSNRHLAEVQGLSGINILRALSNFDPNKANTLSHTSVSSELFRKKWVSLKQEIQDEIRGLLPDPQVLLSLLSSLKAGLTESAQRNKKREKHSLLECDDTEFKVKRKKQKADLVDQGVQIFVSGTNAEEIKDITEGSEAFYMDQNSGDSDTNDDDLITVAEIWGTKDICSYVDVYKDKEMTLYTKVLDVLSLYQRTLPIALSECSFDAFKLLPEDPLLLSTFQQKSILSLLLESTGGLRFSAPGCEGPGSGTGQLYKYLRPLLKLMLYSPQKTIRKDAHLLAYRAMLSTSAFDRNKEEVGVWFSFLPVHNSAQVLLKESREVHSPDSLASDMFGSLGSTVIAFLCDAVSTVGKNLYKYLDELHSHLSKSISKEDLTPPHFSPLVICILEKCLRVVESSSKSLKLAQRTVISIYVASVMNFLLQSQVNSRALAFIIMTMLSPKFQKACQPDQASETFLCEWSPLRSLSLFAQNILSKDQVGSGSNLESMDKQLLGKDSSSISESLSQVLAIIKNGNFVRKDGAAALSSSIVCAMPEEILKNFPLLLNICHKIFEKDYSVLLTLFCIHKELFGQVAEAWPDLILSGLELAGQSFSQMQNNSHHQTQEDDLEDSAVNHSFNFSTMKLRTTEHQSESVCMSDACSEEWDPVAFASFMHSVPFFTLFNLCANSYQSRLLGFASMKGILESKISELPSDSFFNTLHLIMFWTLQIESSWREGAYLKEQLETCFFLLKHVLVYVIETFWSGHFVQRPDLGVDRTSIKEVIKTVLVHPAISMFMSKWMYSSILRNSQDMGAPIIESSDLQCKKWKRKSEKTTFEIFLHLCQAKVHPIDNNILSILTSLVEIASSQHKINPGGALKQWDSFGRTIAEACKPFICRCLSVFKNELLESIKTDSCGISPLPTFYILSVLSPFISPFTLLEFVHWLFSSNISEHQEVEAFAPGPKLPYAHIGLYFATVAFKMFLAYLNQAKEDIVVRQFFWDMDGQKFDANVVGEVYKKVIGIAMKQASESADLCLLSIMKAIDVQRSARVLPRILPISMLLSYLISITPTELVQHCINKTNQLKAKILLLLTQISTLHLTISGELIVANMTMGVADAQLMHLGSALMISDKMLEENSDVIISENELVLLLPVTLRYLCSESRATEVSFLESSKKITSHYFKIIWKGFLKWDEYACCQIFDIVLCDERRCETAEDFASYFTDTLLRRAIYLLQAGFSSEKKSRKSRKKLLSSILPKGSSLLDHLTSDINGSSFEQLLNTVNRVVANVTLARWVLFPKPSCFPLHQERKTDKQPETGASKHSQEKIIQSGAEECKMEPADYARFMNCLICTLDTLFQQFSIQSQESRKHSNLMSFMEKTILSHLVDVSLELEVHSVETQYLSSLKAFTKLTFLHRFEDPTFMKALRHLILSLSQERCASDIVSQFATDALGFLMAHSHFIPTILWTGFISIQSFGQSDKGTMFRSLNGIVKLLALPSLSQHGTPNNEDIVISPGGHSQATHQNSISNIKDSSFLEQRKLEVVKLVRVLYLLRFQKGSSSASMETAINIEELFSLLLAGYGATMSHSDLEIFTLMHEIELLEGSNFSGLSGMNYLWGEAALKRRREEQDEELLSKYNSVDDETSVDRCKRQFRENLIFDPKVCGETVLYFPSKRCAWDGPIDMARYAEESLKGMPVEMGVMPSSDNSNIVCYDPAFILEFSTYVLSVGYVEPMEFARLGLLGLAFASISSSDERMRKLAYDVLGRYKTNLENGRNFKGKPQLQLLLTYVKNAIVEPWQKIPSVLVIFAAEASCILMDPTNNHYPAVNHLLMRAPAMVLESIPLFRSMFGSGSVHFQSDRTWILRLLAAGLNSSEDSWIYRRKFVLEVLLSFYGSSLADFQTKLLVLQVMKKAVKRRTLAQYLVEHAGLLLWLSSAVSNYTQTKSGEFGTCIPFGLTIIVEMIHDLLSRRSIIQWLLTNGLEQLSQIASRLHWFLVYDSTYPGGQDTFIKSVLSILISAVRLSQQRKFYQTRFCLSFQGLFEVVQFIEREDPDMNSREMDELGLKLVLSSSPPAVKTVVDKLQLLKLGMWALSSALQLHSLSNFEGQTPVDKQWNLLKDQERQDALMEKLLRWLVASVIIGMISRTANKGQDLYCPGRTNLASLFSLLKYLKMSRCPSEMEPDSEIDKGLAHLILYLHRLVGVHCRELSSVVTAIGLLLLSDGTDLIDGTSSHGTFSSLLILLFPEVSCPVEANTSWRWSFNSPWRDLSSQISDVQRLYEYEICQVLLINFENFLLSTTPNFHVSTRRQKLDLQVTSPHLATELFDKLDALKVEIWKILSKQQNIQVCQDFVST